MTTVAPSSSPTRFRSAATVPAIILDAAAGLGLLLAVVGVTARGPLLILLFVGALLGLTALPGAILSSVALVSEGTARGIRRWLLVAVAIVLSACSAVAGPAVLLVAWDAAPNAAASRLAPLEQRVRAAGGVRICANGDAGRGPDNFSAWREVYYRLPAAAAGRVAAEARTLGYPLRRVPAHSGTRGGLTAYSGTRAGGDLDVRVATDRIELLCSEGGPYGRRVAVPEGDVVVDLVLSIDPD